MPPVAIVTDTTQYLTPELVRAHDISLVSLYVDWEGERRRESELSDYDAFYARLRDAADLPTTSQPSIGDFLAVWEPLLDEGRDIASVHLAGGISGTVEAARQARALLEERGLGERVAVIDGETACGGLALLALGGVAASQAGADLAGVAEAIAETRRALKIWFAVDTLEYLRRGGRVGLAQAWLGGALKIKPILTMGYEITPVERVRTAGRAFERMVEYMRERQRDGADGWVVQHIQAHDTAERLVEKGREIYGCEPAFVSEVGPVIGTYTGPGLIGVGGVPRSLLPQSL